MAMTIATMGRRMKKRDMLGPRLDRRRPGAGDDLRAVAQRRRVDDDAVAGCSPFSTIQRLPTRPPSVTVLTATMLSGVGDAQLKAALELGHRALRHQQRVLPHGGLRAHAAVLAGAQDVAGIGEDRADADRAHLRIDLAIDGEHRPAMRIRVPSASSSVSPPPACHSLAARQRRADRSAMARYSCSLIGKIRP